ncbi:MAG: glycosyl transferase, family 51 [Frankiales bacterium]|nr:glycosyl transferase, family 51 [Frankiales bacterium]
MRIALALALCVLAGVALAGLAFPVIGGLGLASKSAADQLEPEKPPALVLPQATKILDRNGQPIASLFTENRVTVKLSQIPKVAQDALIAIEDSRFYEHAGIDVKGTLRAVLHNSSNGSTQGGSTLTQQYVKNLLIESASTVAAQKAAVQRSVKRKLQEARYALYLEKHMTKDQILEGYLNIAYYGSGVYGIGTAALHYFHRRVGLLTVGQAAMLAGMVQNPARYDPSNDLKASIARRNVVLDRMVQLGYLSSQQKAKAVSDPVGLNVTQSKSGCEAATTAPFFCDYVRRYLEDGPAGAALGATRQERQERLLSGGLTIRTTLDPKVQDAADKAVRDKVPPTDPSHVIAVADTVEPGTGAIRAIAVNRGFGTGNAQTKVNFAIGGTQGFQGGSTFKAFVLARALQMGISPSLTLNSPNRYCPKAFPYQTPTGCGPSNAGDSESGTFDMVRATWASVNTYFIQLEERTGVDGPLSLAEALGVHDVNGSFAGGDIDHNPSFVFGAAGPHGYSPLAMAGAYAAFAAQGLFCTPNPIVSITDSQGKPVDVKTTPCQQVVEPAVANTLTSILRGVVDAPSAARTGGGAAIGRPVAGKTGTTDEEKAAWFVGYTPQLATAVWIGMKTPTAMQNITINGRRWGAVFGGSISAPIFAELMSAALQGVPVAPMPAMLTSGTSDTKLVAVPDVTGLSTADAQAQLQGAGFGVAVGPAQNAAPIPAGSVARTTPAANAQVPVGATITIIPSNGLQPLPSASPTLTPSPTASPPPPTSQPKPTHKPKPTTGPSPAATP